MNKRTYILLYVFMLLLISAAVLADTPIVSGQVVTDGSVTRYIYTVTNTLSPGNYIDWFGNTEIPDGNILPLLDHSEPIGWDYQEGQTISNGVVLGGDYHWATSEIGNTRLAPGQSAVFEVYTSAPVATQWIKGWGICYMPDNGRPDGFHVDIALPVPVSASVPEPSSVLALFGGLAGIGGLALRRRK
ncbi:MAG: PEP-CTERM sorting domain-containing protein [Armatimonadota bacterium]